MKTKRLLFLLVLLFISCCGCTSKYTLTFEDDKFVEELVISDISIEEEKALIKYVSGSEYLVIDEKKSYKYEEKDKNRIYTYEMGKKLVVSPLINTCFENVYIIDEDDYIRIETDGDYYCQNYKTEVYFKTDKEVIYSNADSTDNNIYKWDSLKNGIKLQFSKTKLADLDKNTLISKKVNDVYVRLIICIVFIVMVIFTVSYFKKRNSE